MKNVNFFNLGAKGTANSGGGNSRVTNHFWRYFASFILLFTLALGNAWGDETYYLQDPAETNGTPALTGDFYTTCPLSFSVSKTYETVTYKNGLTFNGSLSSMGSNCKYPNYQVRYDCKTNNTSITVIVYNKHSSNAKKLYRYTIQENSEIGEANIVSNYLNETITKNSVEAKTYEVKNSTRTSIYFAIEDKSNQSIVQIIAVEKGTKFPEPGEDGYQINFNKMRYIAPSGTAGTLDATSTINGIEMHMSDDGYYSKTAGKLGTNNTNYIKFTVATPMKLNFTTNNTKKYTVSKTKGSTDGKITPTANEVKVIKLTSAGTYYINPQESSVQPIGLSFSAAPKVTYNANGGGGSMNQSYFTVSANGFTAPTGQEFIGWKDGLDNDYAVGDEVESDVTLYAQWDAAVDRYTVVYKDEDGTTDLGSEDVEVGEHPTATGIPATKECYSFASWQLNSSDIALDAASWTSVAKDATVTLTARYTGNYAFGAYSFVNVAEVGTAPNKLTMTNGTTVNVPAGSRVDNFYFSAMAIKYESGASTALNDYKGWKINTKDATIKFLVENNCQVKVAFGSTDAIKVSYTQPNGTEQNDINQAKETETSYVVKGGTIFTIKMATSNTTTLKRITISSVYNVTYTDGTGDASGSASNVTEVTLPAPTETVVGSLEFDGWKANQAVTVDDAVVAANTKSQQVKWLC